MKKTGKRKGVKWALIATVSSVLFMTVLLTAPFVKAWTTSVDTGGDVGQWTSIATWTDIDVSPAQHYVYISYIDVTNTNLKFAYEVNGGGWTTETVDNGVNACWGTSIFVKAGHIYISYFDDTNADLKYAYKASAGAGSWTKETPDTGGANSVGAYSSIAVDSSNGIHISYFNWTSYDLMYVYKASGGSWGTPVTVDSANQVGKYTSIATNSTNGVHITYHYITGDDLKYAYKPSGGGWTTTTVDSTGQVGDYNSIVVDGSNHIYISYREGTNTRLKYAYKDSPSAAPTITIVDDPVSTDVGMHSSLEVTATEKYITYYDNTNGDVKLANYYSGSWHITTPTSGGDVGLYGSCIVNDYLYYSYYDNTNDDCCCSYVSL